MERGAKTAGDGETPVAPTSLRQPGEEDTRRAMQVLAEFLPQLSLPPEELRALSDYQQKTGRSPEARVKQFWQRGDYPGVSAQLGEVQGWPLTEELVPFDQLSRKERLLLWIDWTGDPGLEFTCWQSVLAKMNIAGLQFVDGSQGLKNLWHGEDRSEVGGLWLDARRDREKFRLMLEYEWLPRFASPVTGRFFEPWHESFSAGNGYLRQVMDAKALERIASAVRSHLLAVARERRERLPVRTAETAASGGDGAKATARDRRFSPFSEEHVDEAVALVMDGQKFFYFRIYGERPGSVIAEGLWRVTDYRKLMELKAQAAAIAGTVSASSARP